VEGFRLGTRLDPGDFTRDFFMMVGLLQKLFNHD
jgi:hypothetical protein